MEEGIYLYCIIGTDEVKNFGPIGIGNRGDVVSVINYDDIAAVISKTPMIKYVLNKENLLTHQRVVEEVMKDYTVLPVRFCTIADSVEDIRGVLRKRYTEFKNLLKDMDNKVELGVKMLWKDMKIIFQEIVEEDEKIKRLKDKIASMSYDKSYSDKINLGKMVQTGLQNKKETEAEKIITDIFKGISVDVHKNKIFGDNMLLNAAFLVDKTKVKEFDESVHTFDVVNNEKMKLKYVGPVPPFNFVNIVVEWK